MIVGARKQLNKKVDLKPHATVQKGETGVIDRIDPDTGELWFKLDKHHKGLAEWDNSIWFNEYTEAATDVLSRVDVPQAA
jgi:hypothetical protein